MNQYLYLLIGQVSVSSSAAASMKQGPNGGPVAYISSLSSAKADPKIPAIVNQPMTVNGNAAGTAGIEPAQPKPPPPAPQPAPPGTFLLRIKELKLMRKNILDKFENKFDLLEC